jgi:NAD(P)-dependent dehydrogenase (short-subunit alcohol dehydrogenase family)
MRLQGKTALINSGSGGIEFATARLFASEGGENGWRTDGRSLRSPHSSRLTEEKWLRRTNRRIFGPGPSS